jgi:hypothetical protein
MQHSLQPLIDQARSSTETHVVGGLSTEGIHWRPLPESACQVIKNLLGDDFKVLTREDFIASLESVVREDEYVHQS